MIGAALNDVIFPEHIFRRGWKTNNEPRTGERCRLGKSHLFLGGHIMAKIAVEESLSAVRAALEERGYDVVTLRSEKDAEGCLGCVVTGQDVNVFGVQDAVIAGPVIDARGLSADDVVRELEERIKH